MMGKAWQAFAQTGTPATFPMAGTTLNPEELDKRIQELKTLVETNKVKFVFLCNSQAQTLFNNIEMEPKNYIIEPNAIPVDKYNISEKESYDFAYDILPEICTGYFSSRFAIPNKFAMSCTR